MENDTATQEQNNIQKKHSRSKTMLFVILLVIFFVNIIIYKPFIPSPAQKRYQKVSKEIILKAIAA